MIQSADTPAKEALRIATELYRHKPDWVTFFREIMGVGGALGRLFPQGRGLQAFQVSQEYSEIQKMLSDLRSRQLERNEFYDERKRMITVRVPDSLHKALRLEASDRQTSMNQLCVAKLLRPLPEEEE